MTYKIVRNRALHIENNLREDCYLGIPKIEYTLFLLFHSTNRCGIQFNNRKHRNYDIDTLLIECEYFTIYCVTT